MPTKNLPAKSHDVPERATQRKPPTARPAPLLKEKVAHLDMEDLKKHFKKNSAGWVDHESTAEIYVVRQDKQFDGHTIYIKIDHELNYRVSVDGHAIDQQHPIYLEHLNLSRTKVSILLQTVNKYMVCEGKSYRHNINLGTNYYVHAATTIFKVGDNLPPKMCHRHKKCPLLILGKICKECTQDAVEGPLRKNAPLTKSSTESLIATVKAVRKEEKAMKAEINRLTAEIEVIGHSVDVNIAGGFEKIIETEGNEFQKLFFAEQKKKFGGSGKWHPMLIKYAILLHGKSPAAYEFLRDTGILKLPSKRTLNDYSQYIKPQCGFCPQKIKEIDSQCENLIGHQRYVCLMFDEMKIKEGLVYRQDSLVGWVDLGNESLNATQPESLASHILDIHVVGLSSHVKYPLMYVGVKNLRCGSIFSLIWKAIGILEAICKLKVVACTCDGAAPNKSFIAMHGKKDRKNPCFKSVNIYDRTRFVYFIIDPCHLLKTIRNNLSSSGAHQNSKYLKNDGKYILWNHISALFEADFKRGNLKLLPKIRKDHIYLNSFSKMKVNLAAQVLSETVGNVLLEYGSEEGRETAQVILLVDKFFDFMNIRSPKEADRKRKQFLAPIKDVNDERFDFLLNEFLAYFRKWDLYTDIQCENRSAKEKMFLSDQTFSSLIITCNSVVELSKFLLSDKVGMPFVLTNKLSQDTVEMHFGRHRAIGRTADNPTLSEYMYNDNSLRVAREFRFALTPKGNVSVFSNSNGKCKINVRCDNTPLPKRRKAK